jgi:Domain of unknown function (DUF4234)
MAREIAIRDTGSTAKLRSPLAVGLLSFFTLYIYAWIWWYKINREMADLGRARGTEELGTSPVTSMLAYFPGWLIIVPGVWTYITTSQRLRAAQRLSGVREFNVWIAIILAVLLAPVFYAYLQSELNGVWEQEEKGGGAELPAAPEAAAPTPPEPAPVDTEAPERPA